MNIEIPAEFTPFVQEMISRGVFRDEKDLLVEGLHLLKAREQLRIDVDAGIDQLLAGEGRDGEEVFARLMKRANQIAHNKAE